MAGIRINGRDYDLRLNLWAMQRIEEKYGDAQEALKKFREKRSMSMLAEMFAIMANGGRRHAKLPTDVTEDVLEECTLADMNAVAIAMRQAMDEGMKTEATGGGEADDESRDALAAEYDEKNGLTGGGCASGNTTDTL